MQALGTGFRTQNGRSNKVLHLNENFARVQQYSCTWAAAIFSNSTFIAKEFSEKTYFTQK